MSILTRLICSFILGISLISTGHAVKWHDNAPQFYVVKKDDTLWRIMSKFLVHPSQWRQILGDSVRPGSLQPGDKFILKNTINGKTIVWQPASDETIIESSISIPDYRVAKTQQVVDGLEVVKLEPNIKVIAELQPKKRQSIPLSSIAVFLERDRAIDNDEMLEGAPYIIGSAKGDYAVAGSTVYVRGDIPKNVSKFGIYREDGSYILGSTRLASKLRYIGVAHVISIAEDNSSASVFEVDKAVLPIVEGYKLLPYENNFPLYFDTFVPEGDNLEGVVIDVSNSQIYATRNDMISISLGTKQGLKPGALLNVWSKGENVSDKQQGGHVALPGRKIGQIMVITVSNNISYALVREINEEAIAKGNIVSNK